MGNPTAAHATITNFGGSTRFRETSTADQATIVNGVTGVGSTTQFEDDGDAGQATITNNDSGFTIFLDKSTADKSTITTEDGGRVTFSDESTGGSARLITKAGGNVDISKLTTAGMTVGSIEGGGKYDLGNRILITGGNNLSTEVGGTIVGGADGTLVKIGSGTLTLTGHNTYSGNTIILGGTLELGTGGSISGGLVFVTPGGFKGSSLASNANLASISSFDPTLKLDAPNQISGTIDGFVKGDNIDIAFHNFTAGDHFTWTENVANTGGTLSLLDGSESVITTLNLSGVHTASEFGVASDGSGGTVFTDTVLISTTIIQNDYLAITRTALPLDQATTVANAINAGTQTETQYVDDLLSQVANTTIPAVAVEATMYGATGTSATITSLVVNFLPAQIANATSHGLNPQVYACEALGLAFAFGNETGGTAFANNFGPSNSVMPNSTAGDAAFATAASSTIFGAAASTANLVSVMQQFVSNWKAFYTSAGIPGNATPTADQIDLASRGAAWGDMVGVALANNLGPLNGQVINFLDDAAQGTAIYGASLVGQPIHQPFV